jgi:hypothetical protein
LALFRLRLDFDDDRWPEDASILPENRHSRDLSKAALWRAQRMPRGERRWWSSGAGIILLRGLERVK